MLTYGEVKSNVHALIKELAIGRVEHRLESQHLAEGTEVARLQRRFFFVLQQAGGGACGHPTAPFVTPGVGTPPASYRGGNRVRGTGRSVRGRGQTYTLNPWASFNLEKAARHEKNHLTDAV